MLLAFGEGESVMINPRVFFMGFVFLLCACAGPDEPRAEAEPGTAELIIWTVPKILKVGEPGVLQIKLVSNNALTAPVIVLRPNVPKNFQFPILYRVLTPIAPITDDGGAPGGPAPSGFPNASNDKSLPDHPPALGAVPIEIFDMIAKMTGSHSLTVELYHAGGNIRKTVVIEVAK